MTKSQFDQVMSLKGKATVRAASLVSGCHRRTINKVWRGETVRLEDGPATGLGDGPEASASCLTVDSVLSQFDTVGRLLRLVCAIPSGSLRPDESLRSELSLGSDRWRRVSGSARLAGHWASLPDKSRVWGSKATIASVVAKLKEL